MRRGDFELLLVESDENGNMLGIRRNDFLIFESHVRTLTQAIDEYKYGFGIYMSARPDRERIAWPRLQANKTDPKELRKTYIRYAGPEG
jgi:hypothetical protein